MKELGRIDYEDTFSVPCPAGTSAIDVLLGFFSAAPKPVRILMDIRNRMVSLFGLKTERPVRRVDVSMLQAGGRVGFFEIGSVTRDAAVVGADDAHLNFRVLLNIRDEVLSCQTRVQFNNVLGRIYFFFVRPFHRWIVPMMLKSCVRQPRRPAAFGE